MSYPITSPKISSAYHYLSEQPPTPASHTSSPRHLCFSSSHAQTILDLEAKLGKMPCQVTYGGGQLHVQQPKEKHRL